MNIQEQLRQRILILDGAMGTFIQSLGLPAEAFHQGRFARWPVSLVGNNDVLCLTAPEVIADIHRRYIEADADLLSARVVGSWLTVSRPSITTRWPGQTMSAR